MLGGDWQRMRGIQLAQPRLAAARILDGAHQLALLLDEPTSLLLHLDHQRLALDLEVASAVVHVSGLCLLAGARTCRVVR